MSHLFVHPAVLQLVLADLMPMTLCFYASDSELNSTMPSTI